MDSCISSTSKCGFKFDNTHENTDCHIDKSHIELLLRNGKLEQCFDVNTSTPDGHCLLYSVIQGIKSQLLIYQM